MAAEVNDGEGAPVRFGRGEVVWELRGLMTELARVSARAEELRRGGFDGGVELAGVLWMAAVCSGRGSEEQAKEQAEWSAGVFVRLVRALGEGGSLCSDLATAAARWRPRGRLWARRGRVAEQGGAQRDGKGWWGSSGATCGLAGRRWRGEAALQGGRAALCTAAARTEQRSWRKGKRT